MLKLDARVIFDSKNLSHDLSAKNILRPGINFGNNLLFSGTIIPSADVEVLVRDAQYSVTIELPTVDEEAFEHIGDLVKIGGNITLQLASKILGKGIIEDFTFETE
ncbi:hypothetical protein [Cohnella thermotolerans]|uniref:hypothetical protein n=1 Tax=Cohnella thermotolerans TaxID=329858 RepID=UPI00047DD45C|nr:hypothetical protein [Cohnella thermotolerans]